MESKNRLSVLKRRSDFLSLQKNGFRIRPTDWLLINYAPSPTGLTRCGWTLPRHVGSAVIRNRLKRWSRVFFRQLAKDDELLPVDINLVFRRADEGFYRKLDYETFAGHLKKAWRTIRGRIG